MGRVLSQAGGSVCKASSIGARITGVIVTTGSFGKGSVEGTGGCSA